MVNTTMVRNPNRAALLIAGFVYLLYDIAQI